MSLINDALKRSESDKRRNSSPYFDNLTIMMPDGDDETPPPPRPTFKARRHEKPPTSRLLILALVATAAFGGWYLWSRWTGHVGPQDASADALGKVDKPLTPEQMRVVADRVAPDPTLNEHNTDSLAGAKADDKAKNAKPKAEDAFTAAMRKLQQTRHQTKTNRPPPLHSEPLMSGGKPIQFRHANPQEGSKARDVQWPAPARMKPVEPKAPPTTAPAETSEPPAATEPPAAQEAHKLRVTAIMQGPDGNMALINGSLYREGQTVKGATIVKIRQYEVELVADGKRFTIRI